MLFKFHDVDINERYEFEISVGAAHQTYLIVRFMGSGCCPTYSFDRFIVNNGIILWYHFDYGYLSVAARNYINKVVKLLVFA